MFKCGDKCTGVLAAEARLVREKICYENAKKENDVRTMKNVAEKMRDTKEYIKIMGEWPLAVNLAINPALRVSRLSPPERRAAIMRQVERVQETGINPLNGNPLGGRGITGIIIEYLIAKHDRKPFATERRFLLTKDRIDILNALLRDCDKKPKSAKFLKSLLGEA